MHVIECGSCNTKNRVNSRNTRHIPICGRCGKILNNSRTKYWIHLIVKHKRIIILAGLILIATLLIRVLPEVQQILMTDGNVPQIIKYLLTTILVTVFAYTFMVKRRRPMYTRDVAANSSKQTANNTRECIGEDLKSKIEYLAKLAWGPREDSANVDLILTVDTISNLGSYERIVTALLNHVRKIAPSLDIPMMTPRVTVERLTNAAGQFVEDDGWVKIVVGADFFSKPEAGYSILCHELCHYVLGANGIRASTTEENERLTDIAIFAFGLGDIFLAGYQTEPGVKYRDGHRLGYLKDAEYNFVRDHVMVLWLNGNLQPKKVELLERRLKSAIPDSGARKRLLENARAKHPMKSESELIEFVLEAYERDRR